MSEPEFNYDPENKVDQKHGYYIFFASIIGFGLLNWIVGRFGPPKIVKGDDWRWNNLFISWVHAAIVGTWDILCFTLYPELLDDLVYFINYFTYLIIPFSTGYFIYDFLDLLLNGKILSNWEVTLHHMAVSLGFWYNFHCKMCIGYNVVALMAEINSFFLHSRKLLHMLKFKFENRFYLTICIVNLLTFASCRGWSLWTLSVAMFTESQYSQVPRVYWWCLAASILIMNLINPVLFWRLLKNDILRNIKHWTKGGNSTKTLMNGNNNQNTDIKSKSS